MQKISKTRDDFAALKSQFLDASKLGSDFKVLFDKLGGEIEKCEKKIEEIDETRD